VAVKAVVVTALPVVPPLLLPPLSERFSAFTLAVNRLTDSLCLISF